MGKKATLLNCPRQSRAYVHAETPPGAKEQRGCSFCHHNTETQKELSLRHGITSEMWNTRRNTCSVEVQNLKRTGIFFFFYFLSSANDSRAYSLFFQLVQQPSLMIKFLRKHPHTLTFFRKKKNSCETQHSVLHEKPFASCTFCLQQGVLPYTCARQRVTRSSQFASVQVINPGFQCMEIEYLIFPTEVWYPEVPWRCGETYC